jgi:hypothetical protein
MCAESECVHSLVTSMDFHCHGVNFILICNFDFLNFNLGEWVFTLLCMACEEGKVMKKNGILWKIEEIKQHVTNTQHISLLPIYI